MSESDKPDTNEPGESGESLAALAEEERKPDSDGTAPTSKKVGRKRLFNMVGRAFGHFVLLLLAVACGGLIAIYWPWIAGAGVKNSAMADRVAALENRVGQIAANKAPETSAATFEDLQHQFAALKERLDADETRLNTVEGPGATTSDADLTALKAAISKNSAAVNQLGEQVKMLAADAADVPPNLNQTMTKMQDAVTTLSGKLDATTKAVDAAMIGLNQRVAALEKTAPPADLAQQLRNMASKSDVSALGARVNRLEARDAAGLMRRAASVLALADLVRASEGEAPFANELHALKAVMPPEPEIADLSHYASTGAPTVPTLTKRFEARIDVILSAERDAQARNWAERLWGDVVGLISVRRVGNVPGDDTQARVARAEYALKHGDLVSAIHEIEALDKPAKSAAMPWLADAKARLAVSRDARTLTNRIMSDLAAADAERKAAGAPPSGDTQ